MNKIFNFKKLTSLLLSALLILSAVLLFVPQSVQTKSTPSFLSFEGQLTDSNGNRISNKHDLTIRIYDSKTGGNKLFEETHNSVNPDKGYFSVVIGSNKKLDLDFEQRYWISLEVDSDGEMSPRRPINTVGYSFASDITYGTYATSSQPTPTSSGKMYFNTSTNKLHVDTGSEWKELADLSHNQTFSGQIDFTNTTTFNSTTVFNSSNNFDATTTFNSQTTINGNANLSTTTISDQVNVDSGTLFVDTKNNRVGVNTSSPTTDLEIKGNIKSSGNVTTTNLNATDSITLNGDRRTVWPSGSGSSVFSTTSGKIFPNDTSKTLLAGKSSTSSKNSAFEVGGTTILDNDLAISTTSPDTALEVSGDIKNSGNVTTTNISATGGNITFGTTDISESNISALDDGVIDLSINETTGKLDLSSSTTISTGSNLTLSSGDQLSVDDNYLFNDGDTATGNYNFGSGDIFVDDSEGKVSLGTSATSTNEDINIDGTVNISGQQYPTTDGSNGQALTTDGSGTLSFGNIDKDILANNGTLSFDWSDANVANDLTVSSSGSVATSSLANDDFLQNDGDTATGNYDFTSGNLAVNSSSADTALEVSGDIKNSGNVTTTHIQASGLTNCDTLDTDGNGVFSCGTDAGAIILDIDDDGSNESSAISEIASTNDSNNIATEDSADKLLFDMSKNWPTADSANDLTAGSSVVSDSEVDNDITISSSGSVATSSLSSDDFLQNDGDTATGNYDFTSGNLAVNSSSADTALEVNGDITNSSTFFTDTANDRVGINTSSPSKALHISGDEMRLDSSGTFSITDETNQNSQINFLDGGAVQFKNDAGGSFGFTFADNSGNALAELVNNGHLSLSQDSGKLRLGNNQDSTLTFDGTDTIFEYDNQNAGTAAINFDQNGNTRMQLGSNGFVGINTTSPDSQLEVAGDISVGQHMTFGTNTGTEGFGIRSNGGVMEFRNTPATTTAHSSDWTSLSSIGSLQYTIQNDSWSDTNETLPSSLAESQIAVIDDYVYLFGGDDGAPTDAIYRAPVSDPTNWSDTGSDLPDQLSGSQVAVVGDFVYLFGGGGGDNRSVYRAPVSDPTNWSDTNEDLPPSRLERSQTAIIGDYIYLFGGYNGAGDDAIYRANISSNSGQNKNWKQRSNPIKGKWYKTSTSSDSNIAYTSGGNVGIGTSSPQESLHVDDGNVCVTEDGSCDANWQDSKGGYLASRSAIVEASDLAEMFPSSQNLDEGELVKINNSTSTAVKRTSASYSKDLIGIVSTDPGLTLGAFTTGTYPIALSGRVPAKVSDDGGAIQRGDPITASSKPGVGMKATSTGKIVGFALEPFSGTGTGTIKVFVTPDYRYPETQFKITQNGNIGIGTTTPDTKLDVDGKIQADNLKGGATSLSVDSQGNIIRSPSDERLKDEIEPVDQPLEKVAELDGVTYNWKDKNRFGPDRNIGLLAQEVNETVPQAVETGGEYMSVNYNNITALLVEAVKEQQEEIRDISTGKQIQGGSSDMDSKDISISTSSEFGSITVEDHVTFGGDTVGEAVVKRGYNKVAIDFEKKYERQPVVTANQIGEPVDGLNYSVTDISTAGFKIMLDSRYEQDIKFSWHAFAAGEDSKIHLSDGTTTELEVNVEEIKGCTNPEAENYDSNATKDDGSCKIPGCIDVKAENYDPDATIGDGSCSYSESDSQDSSSESTDTKSSSESGGSSSTSTESNKDTSEDSTTTTDKTSEDTQESTTTTEKQQDSENEDTSTDQQSTDTTTTTKSGSTDDTSSTSTSSNNEQTEESADSEGSTTSTTETSEDTTDPEIEIIGSETVAVDQGSDYTDDGATASDNKDGDLTDKIQITNNVDTSQPGSYTVSYTIEDEAGNSTTKQREVTVEKVEESESSSTTTTQKTTTESDGTTTTTAS